MVANVYVRGRTARILHMLRKLLALVAIVMLASVGVAEAQTGGSNLPNSTLTGQNADGSGNSGEPGDTATCESTGWQPGSDVECVLNSDPVRLGTAKADANGKATLAFKVPNVPAGVHTLTASGIGANGQPRTLSAAFVVEGPSGSSGGGLAKTGTSHSKPIAQIGAGAVAVGGLLVLAANKRRQKAKAAA
jgi:hypothetical protein